MLTLCPERRWRLQQLWDAVTGAATLRDDRELARRQSEASWTARDVDVRADCRAAVALSGDARWRWTHGTRLGVVAPGEEGLCDWWGRRADVLPRAAERHSVVFAFAAAEEEEGGGDAGTSGGGSGGAGGAAAAPGDEAQRRR